MGYGWNWESLRAYRAKRARQDGKPVDSDTLDTPAKVAAVEAAFVERILERDVMPAVLAELEAHPLVAWVSRVNVGGVWHGEQYVRYGDPGMSDITGQLIDGRRLECECKAPDGSVTNEQQAYIDKVNLYGGLAFVARSTDDVTRALGPG